MVSPKAQEAVAKAAFDAGVLAGEPVDVVVDKSDDQKKKP